MLARFIGEAARVRVGDCPVAPGETVGPGGDVEATEDVVAELLRSTDFEAAEPQEG